MTACVNRKHTKKVAAVVTASLVGALSLGVAPVAAVADTGVDMLSKVQGEQDAWDAATFEWNADRNAYGIYTVDEGDVFALESVTDVYGNAVSAGDYMVVYFDATGTNVVDSTDAIDGQPGGMPKTADNYTAAVVKLNGAAPDITDGMNMTSLTGKPTVVAVHKVTFTVAPEVKTLDGAFAFNGTTPDDVADTTFNYTGNKVDYSFADAEGNVLTTRDYDITWITGAPASSNTAAGTYTALLTGKGSYAGSQATVSFTVAKLDLSKADITVGAVTDLDFSNNYLNTSTNDIWVNGDKLAAGTLDLIAISYTDNTGSTTQVAPNQLDGNVTNVGTYQLKVQKNASVSSDNVTGGPATATVQIVSAIADVKYDEDSIASKLGSVFETFETSKNEAFDPSLFTADVSGDEVPLNVTVTKDGQEVTSYTEPGEYVVKLEVPTPPNCAYGFVGTVKFQVVSKKIDDTKVNIFASINGKALNDTTATPLPYTGEAMVPSIVVKEGKKVLTAGEDYTVTYRVAGEKDAIESMVEPEDYEIVVSFPGTGNPDKVIKFEITKATIQSVKPAAPVVAYTGEAVKPDFIGYTGLNYGGTEVKLSNAEVGVKYFVAKWSDSGTPGDKSDDKYVKDTAVSASNLKDEGVYFAEVTVNSNNEHFKGTATTTEVFQISKKAGFADVNASAWYAGAVYQARELGYVNGLSGTNLFAPEADITRADAVCILFNMAGGQVGSNDFQYNENTGYNTGFSDVDGHAYFAKALAWAHASGVANGSNGEFRPYDQITREEFASLLANFAKSKGEYVAADESALDGMSDAASVSDWAKENVAWAVSNKVMGNGGFIAAQDNIIRAEVAAMAVNYQPEAL